MGEEDNDEYEPVEKDCERCELEGCVNDMVDCPKFEEDLRKRAHILVGSINAVVRKSLLTTHKVAWNVVAIEN